MRTYDAQVSAPAGPKTGEGIAYPVRVDGGPPTHLTVTSVETLCNRSLGPAATVVTSFGMGDCATCRKMAQARDLEVALSGPRALAIGGAKATAH